MAREIKKQLNQFLLLDVFTVFLLSFLFFLRQLPLAPLLLVAATNLLLTMISFLAMIKELRTHRLLGLARSDYLYAYLCSHALGLFLPLALVSGGAFLFLAVPSSQFLWFLLVVLLLFLGNVLFLSLVLRYRL